jgi:hypothetical protein
MRANSLVTTYIATKRATTRGEEPSTAAQRLDDARIPDDEAPARGLPDMQERSMCAIRMAVPGAPIDG